MRTYHVQTKILCNRCANKLTKFIKNLKKITDVLLILLHLYIKYQDQPLAHLHLSLDCILVIALSIYLSC
jgi:hypothetical protein